MGLPLEFLRDLICYKQGGIYGLLGIEETGGVYYPAYEQTARPGWIPAEGEGPEKQLQPIQSHVRGNGPDGTLAGHREYKFIRGGVPPGAVVPHAV